MKLIPLFNFSSSYQSNSKENPFHSFSHTIANFTLGSDKNLNLINQTIANLKQWGLEFLPSHSFASNQKGRRRLRVGVTRGRRDG